MVIVMYLCPTNVHCKSNPKKVLSKFCFTIFQVLQILQMNAMYLWSPTRSWKKPQLSGTQTTFWVVVALELSSGALGRTPRWPLRGLTRWGFEPVTRPVCDSALSFCGAVCMFLLPYLLTSISCLIFSKWRNLVYKMQFFDVIGTPWSFKVLCEERVQIRMQWYIVLWCYSITILSDNYS